MNWAAFLIFLYFGTVCIICELFVLINTFISIFSMKKSSIMVTGAFFQACLIISIFIENYPASKTLSNWLK